MRAVFVTDCSCALGGLAKVEHHATDRAAMASAYRHWQVRLCEDDDHRYWAVHGPSGHLIALHGTPLGRLPPLPYDDE